LRKKKLSRPHRPNERKNMKHKDFKPCVLCGEGMMHSGHPIFLRITVEQLGIDCNAVNRARGMELMMGGNAMLANIMGADENLAKVIDGKSNMLICLPCAEKPLPPYFWLNGEKQDEAA
jgi:hypothetical protein